MTTLLPPLLVQQGCQVVPGRATAQESARGTACTRDADRDTRELRCEIEKVQ